jgi:hypothetical protein
MNQSFKKLVLGLALSAILAVSGCAGGVSAVGEGPYAVGRAYNVTLGRTWNDISNVAPQRVQNLHLLTLDGPLLDRLYLAHDIAPGAGLIRPANREDRVPVYRADMTSRELVEFLNETIAAWGYTNVANEALRPADFAGRQGVQFVFTAQTKEGLNLTGRAAAAAQNSRLQAVVYLAPTEHYYAANQAEVDAIFASVLGATAAPPAPPAAAPTTPDA